MYLPRTIKHLSLSGCEQVTDACLPHLPPLLEKLNLTGCTGVTDEGLSKLPQTVKYLNLSNNPNITTRGLASLSSAWSLQYLVLRECPNVTEDCDKVLPHGVLVYM